MSPAVIRRFRKWCIKIENGRHFTMDICRCIDMKYSFSIFFHISPRPLPKVPVHNTLSLIQVTAWCRTGNNACMTWMNDITWINDDPFYRRIYGPPGLGHLNMMTSSNGNIFRVTGPLCGGNSPVPGEFPTQRPVTRSFDVFFELRLNKRLSKQSSGWWFETPSYSLWRRCNEKTAMV